MSARLQTLPFSSDLLSQVTHHQIFPHFVALKWDVKELQAEKLKTLQISHVQEKSDRWQSPHLHVLRITKTLTGLLLMWELHSLSCWAKCQMTYCLVDKASSDLGSPKWHPQFVWIMHTFCFQPYWLALDVRNAKHKKPLAFTSPSHLYEFSVVVDLCSANGNDCVSRFDGSKYIQDEAMQKESRDILFHQNPLDFIQAILDFRTLSWEKVWKVPDTSNIFTRAGILSVT